MNKSAAAGTTSARQVSLAGSGSGVIQLHNVPEISIHAFADTPEMKVALETMASDRRMARAHVEVLDGGLEAAIARYGKTPSPNLLIIESQATSSVFRERLEVLADACHAGTRLLLIGHVNDVAFYRDLLAKGVSEYLVAPVPPLALIACISRLYDSSANEALGRTIAFVGAKGGVGSSTVAHNVASTLGRLYGRGVLLADLDHPFGSARLCFGLEENPAVGQALREAERLDYVLLERVLAKCERHLSVLTAPSRLEEPCDHSADAFEHMLDIAQRNMPFVVLDLPHVWTSWSRRTLLAADEVVVCAQPDLVGLQNARNIFAQLIRLRPNDAPPRLILNQVGMPRRSEITSGKFGEALGSAPVASIPFDPATFSSAGNKGKMIADIAPKSGAAKSIAMLARLLSGHEVESPVRRGPRLLGRLLGR
jgi:pilus assembly protein CpaE